MVILSISDPLITSINDEWEQPVCVGMPEMPWFEWIVRPSGIDPETRETTWVEDWVRMMLK